MTGEDGVALLRACVEKRGGTTGVLNQRADDRRGKERDPRTYDQRNTGTRPVDTEDANGARDSKDTNMYMYKRMTNRQTEYANGYN